MKIIRDRENDNYSIKNKILGNCITVIADKEYYYEFNIKDNESLIKTNDLKYIEEAIDEFRKYNLNIIKFYTNDNTFYKEFDYVYTFKLPIKILQPSQFFIDKDKLKNIEENLNYEEISIPVCIINDEYVILDGHTRLYALYENDYKMVNVYIDNQYPHIDDFVYMAKENNIFSIKNLQKLSHDEYDKYWNKFCDDYFEAIKG